MDLGTASDRIAAQLALRGMTPGRMIEFLARVAKEAREEAGRKQIHIAVEVDVDPSTVYRFEQGHWPRHPDDLINAYAADLGIEPRELWERALALWVAEATSSPAQRAKLAAQRAAARTRTQQRQAPEGQRRQGGQGH